MSFENLRDFLLSLDLCETCILRYMSTDFNSFEHSLKALNNDDSNIAKKTKRNTCFACLGVFQKKVANEIIENSNLSTYECSTIYSSISIPLTILIRELSIWIELLHRFPENINQSKKDHVQRILTDEK